MSKYLDETGLGKVKQIFDNTYANQSALAPVYDPTLTYEVGDLCMYNGKIYKCTSAISTPEAWTAAHWQVTSIDEETKDLKEADVDVDWTGMLKYSGVSDGLSLPPVSQMELKRVTANSYQWNQHVKTINATNWEFNDASGSFDNGIATFVATAQNGRVNTKTKDIPAIIGHKLLFFAYIKTATATDKIQLYSFGGYAAKYCQETTAWQAISFITQVGNWGVDLNNNAISIFDKRTSDWDQVQVKYVVCVDLTVEGLDSLTTVEQVEAEFNKRGRTLYAYNPYDAGSLISTDIESLETTGVNQFDGELEKGSINASTGGSDNNDSGNYWRPKHFTRVISGANYYFKVPTGFSLSNCNISIYCYDGSKNYLSHFENRGNAITAMPTNCCYVKFVIYLVNAQPNAPEGACINVSDSSLNGQCFPFVKQTNAIGFSGKSAGTAHDYKEGNVEHRLVGSVDLSTLTFSYDSTNGYFYVNISGYKLPSSNNVVVNAICSKYQVISAAGVMSGLYDLTIGFTNDHYIIIKDTSLNGDATAITGTLYFELATPIQTIVETSLPNAIAVYQGGSEAQKGPTSYEIIPATLTENYDVSIKDQVITNVKVDARQEEEIAELRDKLGDCLPVISINYYDASSTDLRSLPEKCEIWYYSANSSGYYQLYTYYRTSLSYGRNMAVLRNETELYALTFQSSEAKYLSDLFSAGAARYMTTSNAPTIEKIYGVSGINQGTTLTRTDSAVGITITYDNDGKVISPFDGIYPWSDIERVYDKDGNAFIKIPKFYSKKSGNVWKISGTKHDGFTTLFVDGKGGEIPYVLVGCYKGYVDVGSSKLKSLAGVSPAVSETMATFRGYAQANGEGYQLTDYLIRSIIEMLFVIEFATTDSQSVMRGLCSVSASHTTGGTDGIANTNDDLHPASGQPTNRTSGAYQCKYRGIEDPWGNVWEFCDGISFDGSYVYASIDPSDYESGKITGTYRLVGQRATSSGDIQTITAFDRYPDMGYVTAVGTSDFGDYSWYDAGGQILFVGGRWVNGSDAGLFYLDGSSGAGASDAGIGCRLCYKPS